MELYINNLKIKEEIMRYFKNNQIVNIYELRELHPNVSMNDGNDLSHLGYRPLIETEPPVKEGYYAVEGVPSGNIQTQNLVKEEVVVNNATQITIRQVREVLIDEGLLDNVQTFINNIPDELLKKKLINYWEYSQDFDRNHPMMLQLIELLQISDEDADELFIGASKL